MSLKNKNNKRVRCVSREDDAFNYFEQHGKTSGGKGDSIQTRSQLDNSRSNKYVNTSWSPNNQIDNNSGNDGSNAMGDKCSIKGSKSSNLSKTAKDAIDLKSSR